MKKGNYKLIVCALAAASFSTVGVNNVYANAVDNNVSENILSTADKDNTVDASTKADEAISNVQIENADANDKNTNSENTVQETPASQAETNTTDKTAEVQTETPKVQDQQAIDKMNQWKQQRPSEDDIKAANTAYDNKTVVSVAVDGGSIIPNDEVKKLIQIKEGDKFDWKKVEADRDNIYNSGYFYDNYPSFEVVPEGVKITYHVMENPILRSIDIRGNHVYSTDKIEGMLGDVQIGKILNLKALNTDLANIEAKYHEDGYILAKLQNISIDESGNLSLVFNEGILEGYVVKGNDKTKDYVITREMRIKPGEVFDAKKARRSMQRVYNLGFFDDVSVKILPGKVDPNNVIMELTVVEKRTGSFGIGAGYSSEDGLLGMISIGDTNFRGTGDSVKAMYEFGGDNGDDRGYSISYTKPWLDQKETTGTFRIYDRKYEYDDYNNDGNLIETYDRKTQGYELSFGRPINEYTTNYLGFKVNKIEYDGHVSDLDRGGAAYQDWRDSNFGETRSIIASQVRDTRDNIYFPTDGSRTSMSVEYAGLGGDFDYTKFTVSGQKYYKVGHAQVIAVRGTVGYANEDLPEGSLFEVGGQSSVRGYRDGQFSGNKMVLSTIEYRYPIMKKVQGAIFADVGDAWSGKSYSWNSIEDNMTLHTGIGTGIQMETPIGALRLDYGWGEDGGRLHFTVGGTF